MTQISFRQDMTVELVRGFARDSDVVAAAKVSTIGELSKSEFEKDAQSSIGLINYLLRNRHGSPFEHNSMTFMISAPIFVFREFHRHRIGWSYNEASGRYRQLEPIFYYPNVSRNLIQSGKTGHYEFLPGTTQQHDLVLEETINSCTQAYEAYEKMLTAGIAREVARGVLPLAIYSTMYATCNARSMMAFLSLRTQHENSLFPSFPQREIAMVADQMEAYFAELMPITHAAFVKAGRVSP